MIEYNIGDTFYFRISTTQYIAYALHSYILSSVSILDKYFRRPKTINLTDIDRFSVDPDRYNSVL